MLTRETFRPAERITRRSEYQIVYERGARVQGRFMTVFVLPTSLQVSRLGIAATRKLGGAVERNRARRLVREIFRRNKIQGGYDIVVVPRAEMLAAEFAGLEADYRSSLKRRVRA